MLKVDLFATEIDLSDIRLNLNIEWCNLSAMCITISLSFFLSYFFNLCTGNSDQNKNQNMHIALDIMVLFSNKNISFPGNMHSIRGRKNLTNNCN